MMDGIIDYIRLYDVISKANNVRVIYINCNSIYSSFASDSILYGNYNQLSRKELIEETILYVYLYRDDYRIVNLFRHCNIVSTYDSADFFTHFKNLAANNNVGIIFEGGRGVII